MAIWGHKEYALVTRVTEMLPPLVERGFVV